MNGFDFKRLQKILLSLGVLVVSVLWIGEEMGLLLVVNPSTPQFIERPQADPPLGLVLQGVIIGNDSAPGVAILAETGKRPVLVPEGASFSEDILVDRVLADRVILLQRSTSTPIVLPLAPMAGGDAPTPPMTTSRNALSAQRDEPPLPLNRIPPPADASGPSPGPGLSGPALPGPVAATR